MGLRLESVQRRLARLEEVISQLREIDPASLSDPLTAWAAERGLQLGAEILFDVGAHLLTSHFGHSPESYEEILAGTARHQVISAALHERLQGLGGFRNILVHDYLRLDPKKVADALRTAPDDFDDFARAVREWLTGFSSPP